MASSTTLEELYKEKESTTDKRELRKIRHKIRKHLRARGQYIPRNERPKRKRTKEEKSPEELALSRAASQRSNEERERRIGHRAQKFWRSLNPLHTYICRCAGCTISITTTTNRIKPPFKAWYTILLRRGLKVRKEQIRPAYEKIRKGQKPTKPWSLLLMELMRASGWF